MYTSFLVKTLSTWYRLSSPASQSGAKRLRGVEMDCGSTSMDGFRGRCPSSLFCDERQPNRICCPAGAPDCTEITLSTRPLCANATWDLFDNGGFFCCEHGSLGYNVSNTNGCTFPGQVINGSVIRPLRATRSGIGNEKLRLRLVRVRILILRDKPIQQR